MNLAEQLAARGAAKAGGKRRAKSTRFRPYYKVQVFNHLNGCWKDIQRAHESAEEARATVKGASGWRIMEITPKGRRILK